MEKRDRLLLWQVVPEFTQGTRYKDVILRVLPEQDTVLHKGRCDYMWTRGFRIQRERVQKLSNTDPSCNSFSCHSCGLYVLFQVSSNPYHFNSDSLLYYHSKKETFTRISGKGFKLLCATRKSLGWKKKGKIMMKMWGSPLSFEYIEHIPRICELLGT